VVFLASCSDDKTTASTDNGPGFHPLVAGTPWQVQDSTDNPTSYLFEFYPNDSLGFYYFPTAIAYGSYSVSGNQLTMIRSADSADPIDLLPDWLAMDTLTVTWQITSDNRQMQWRWEHENDSLDLSFISYRP
jgi:hypothetical protein